MINYSIIFTNNSKELNKNLDKYICFDNKIHIRFKDFNAEEFIVGFEKKLTYLLSYLINYCYMPTLIGDYTNKEILTSFLLYNDVLKIIDFFKKDMESTVDFAGFLLKPNYKKHREKCKEFGETDIKFFPLQIKNNLIEAGNLNIFLKTFNINLYDYLFNDDYVIWLHDKEFKVNKKFDMRKLKKTNRQLNKDINIVELW